MARVIEPPQEPVEFEPFVAGREVRTFSLPQWRQLMAGMVPKIRVRTERAARLVLVDRMSYKLAAVAAGETPAMVRGAVMSVMERLGLMGAAWFMHDPDKTLVLRNIPPQFHGEVRRLVAEQVKAWQALGTPPLRQGLIDHTAWPFDVQ